ncbi:HNH endonuclease [bacterium]|nr:HNH endonuclease [bacterium]
MVARLHLDYVTKVFEDMNLELIDKIYYNSTTKLNYVCKSCGYLGTSTFSTMSRNKGCPKCIKKVKHTYKYIDVVEYLAVDGYKLISNEYINTRQRLEIECIREHKTTIAFRDWLRGSRCYICYLENLEKINPNKLNLPLYSTYAPQLESYQNVHKVTHLIGEELLGFSCTLCEKKFVPTVAEVLRRVGCINGKIRGEGNLYCSSGCKKACPTYGQKLHYKDKKPYKRSIPRKDQPIWAKLVKERDNYTCQKCGVKDKVMYAHHIDPINNNPIESADVDNGITLCETCNKLVHLLPGCSYTELRC